MIWYWCPFNAKKNKIHQAIVERNHVYIQALSVILGVSEKRYGIADYWYLKNGNTQQCNVFRNNKYNVVYLVVCEVSAPYIKHN